jgi:poly-gamma-glutamate synthesis protein (capsule biosynthesis protein)
MSWLGFAAVGAAIVRAETPDTPIVVAHTTLASVPTEPPSTPLPQVILPSTPEIASLAKPARKTLSIMIGGDLGLNGSGNSVNPEGAIRHGARLPWSDLTAGIAPLLNADINFANLETVVTDRNSIEPVAKTFNFRSHPAGVRHLVAIGFNAFSTANNHAIDYGEPGMVETLRHLQSLSDAGLQAWPGIGYGRDALLTPATIIARNAKVRISAIGIGGGGLPKSADQSNRIGMASYHQDHQEAVARLNAADGDLRVLSVHYGAEMQIRPAPHDERRLRETAQSGVDLVVAHHAHVPAGIQDVDGKLVFYGMGNLMHPGMQDMARLGICRDFGVVARLHYTKEGDGGYQLRAIEIIPLRDMHQTARPRISEDGRQRIEVLNYHAAGLDNASSRARGVRFAPQDDGSGLFCAAGAERETDRIGLKCHGFTEPQPQAAALTARLANACAGGEWLARRNVDQERTADAVASTRRGTGVTNREANARPIRFDDLLAQH